MHCTKFQHSHCVCLEVRKLANTPADTLFRVPPRERSVARCLLHSQRIPKRAPLKRKWLGEREGKEEDEEFLRNNEDRNTTKMISVLSSHNHVHIGVSRTQNGKSYAPDLALIWMENNFGQDLHDQSTSSSLVRPAPVCDPAATGRAVGYGPLFARSMPALMLIRLRLWHEGVDR